MIKFCDTNVLTNIDQDQFNLVNNQIVNEDNYKLIQSN